MNNELKEFRKLSDNEKWDKRKTLESVVWCCIDCDAVILSDGNYPKREWMGELYCSNCDALLTRRTNGGQGDPFGWKPKKVK